MVHVLVPVKDLALAKSRLSSILTVNERRTINQAMLEDVLYILSQHSHVKGTVLISGDPAVALLAHQYNTELFGENDVNVHDLNTALSSSCDHLAKRGIDKVLIVHSDMPLLGLADLDKLLERGSHKGTDIVLGPDHKDEGTNAMLLSPLNRPTFHFGPRSFLRHKADALHRGLNFSVVRRPGIQQDVDTAADLSALYHAIETHELGHKTSKVLYRTDFTERLHLPRQAGIYAIDNRSVAPNE